MGYGLILLRGGQGLEVLHKLGDESLRGAVPPGTVGVAVDNYAHQIVKYLPYAQDGGKGIRYSYGSEGSGDGQFGIMSDLVWGRDPLSDVGSNNDYLYVADDENGRIVRLELDNGTLRWDRTYALPEGFWCTALEVGGFGQLYAADYLQSVILKMTADLEMFPQYGTVGSAEGQFVHITSISNPLGVRSGDLFIAEDWSDTTGGDWYLIDVNAVFHHTPQLIDAYSISFPYRASDSIGYTVEMEIPWGTLRYANGKDVWGVNLARAIPRRGEIAYSAPVSLSEGFHVSRFMQLSGLKPQVRTHGIEFCPQGFFRTEKSNGERSETWHPAADLNWALTPSWRLQSTFNPDFSQVEADPFALNLSKYGLFFDEKRLFFVEGDEYFQPSGGVMADMLQIFYSRQVGMKLPDGAEIPIYAGGRTTAKIKNHEVAALFAQTGAKSYEGFAGPDREPAAAFAVARMNLRVATPTTAAVTFAGKLSDSTANSALALDGTTSEDTWQFTYQLARSETESEADWAFKSYVDYFPGKFSVCARTTVIGDRFDVSEIGFVPWSGLRSYSVSAGPVVHPDSGLFVYGALRLTADVSRELGEARYSKSCTLQLEGALRNNWGFGSSVQIGREYEIAGAYNPRAWVVSVQTDGSRRAWLSVSYYSVFQYNYLRQYFGRSDFATLFSSWRPSKRLWTFLGGSAWVKRRPNGGIDEVTWRLRPGVSYAIARGMDVRLYEETPICKTTGVVSFRLGFSYSYNFAPKSWLYLAINDWQLRDSDNGRYVPQQRVLAVKIKYLFSL